jgi:hypothetical protein
MHPHKRTLAEINIVGGAAVLGSYALGLATHPETGAQLWGDVPQAMKSFYIIWMFVATAGYFGFASFLLFRLDHARARIGGRIDSRLFSLLLAAILAPSAVWMPLTFEMLERPSDGLWLTIRLVLWTVGLASLGLVVALFSLRPRRPASAYRIAVVGSIVFTVQTLVLDALIWPAHFPV